MTTTPALVMISHGTCSAQGQQVVRRLADDAATAAATRDLTEETQLGHVDVQQPDVAATLGALTPGRPAVAVPLLLSAGFHVNVDLKKAVSEHHSPVVIAPALGPDDRLVELLVARLEQAGADPQTDGIILAGAGSSDANAVADVREMTARLAKRLNTQVQDAYLAFAEPSVADAVTAVQSTGRRAVVANYLLAPGYFDTKLRRQGADVVTAPLLPPPGAEGAAASPQQLVDIVCDRFRTAAEQL
ncbi:sirohydrochlorin chelatase [Nesterenkonia alba]|uniref:sirohydrochlorin chelatase n=1 Tax=Nesterenkonia alba TaxID=515814 RepID=UPI0003B6F4A5|nr:CbiX/SirB N-terminal domain-containing protein [Nesterenkonia alba]